MRGSHRRLLEALLHEIYGEGVAASSSASEDSNGPFWGQWTVAQGGLHEQVEALRAQVGALGNYLGKKLRLRDSLRRRRDLRCDVVTALLRARAASKGEEARVRFSVAPPPSDSGFAQWRDAMRMVAKLPGGIPPEFRRRLWLTLAERHLAARGVDWTLTERVIFNDTSNPDDEDLGVQIVKDLHRTGCSLFCGESGEHNQVLLKRVLLAYARWNKNVGYCQGFNMLAALILQCMDRNEADSVKVMIFLIEGVLPESYFANNLRGLSVDMAVFRELLRLRLPRLSSHLETLQAEASGAGYEPPLTNVFTMQWFLTLFANCLPHNTVFRLWDLVFLEGNEVLLRAALAIWSSLQERILAVDSADEFYSIMGVLTREMVEFGLADANQLVIAVVAIEPVTELSELRDRFTYNITPWAGAVGAARRGLRMLQSDDDTDEDLDEDKMAVTAAFGLGSVLGGRRASLDRERLNLDISALKQQYTRLRERQRQAHIIISAACSRPPGPSRPVAAPVVMNHLLLGRTALKAAPRRPSAPALTQLHTPQRPISTPAPRRASNASPATGGTIRWHELRTGRSPSPIEGGRSSSSTSTASSDTELCDSDGSDTEGNASPLPKRGPTRVDSPQVLPSDTVDTPPPSDTLVSVPPDDQPDIQDNLQPSDKQDVKTSPPDFLLPAILENSTPSDTHVSSPSSDTQDSNQPNELDTFEPDTQAEPNLLDIASSLEISQPLVEETLVNIPPPANLARSDEVDILVDTSLMDSTENIVDTQQSDTRLVDVSTPVVPESLARLRPDNLGSLPPPITSTLSPLMDSPFELMPLSPVPPAIPPVLSPVRLTESDVSPVQDAPNELTLPSSGLSSVQVSSLDMSSIPSVQLSPDSILSDIPTPERAKSPTLDEASPSEQILEVQAEFLTESQPQVIESLSPVNLSEPFSPVNPPSHADSSSPDFSFSMDSGQKITIPAELSPIPSPVKFNKYEQSERNLLSFDESPKEVLRVSDLSDLDAFLSKPLTYENNLSPLKMSSKSDQDNELFEPQADEGILNTEPVQQDDKENKKMEFAPVQFSNFEFFSLPKEEQPEENSSSDVGCENLTTYTPELQLAEKQPSPEDIKVSSVNFNKPSEDAALDLLLPQLSLPTEETPKADAEEEPHSRKLKFSNLDLLCSSPTPEPAPTLPTVRLSPDEEEVKIQGASPELDVPDLVQSLPLAVPVGSLSAALSSPSEAALPDLAPLTPPRALSPLSPMLEGSGPRKRWTIALCEATPSETGEEEDESGAAERRARALQVIQENSEILQRIVQQPPSGAAGWGRALSEERPHNPFPRPRLPNREVGLRLGLYRQAK